MAMGSVVGTLKDTVDDLRDDAFELALLSCVRTAISGRPKYDEIGWLGSFGILDKISSLGFDRGTFPDVKASLYHDDNAPKAFGFIAGLGAGTSQTNVCKDV